MGVFRFANAVSDMGKFINTYKVIYKNLKDASDFNHDDARDVLIRHSLVSSSGAIGQEAVNRSVRDDRSLDPLYNQVKMYSEVFRMLGWYKPSISRGDFSFTHLSEYVAEADINLSKKLFEFSVKHIVAPNPLVEIKGGNLLRPFPFILKLMHHSDGVLTRDEMIVTILNCQSDREESYFEAALEKVSSLRKNYSRIGEALNEIMISNKISKPTLENYTRFPLGTLKYLNWANPARSREIYPNKTVNGYFITDYGIEQSERIQSKVDIRHDEILRFDISIRAAFTLLMLYRNLEELEYDLGDDLLDCLKKLDVQCAPLLDKFGIRNSRDILYSPIQESSFEEIEFAEKMTND
ncbi:hypothetical protein ACFLT1_08495 [Bacteroidota bacterium]